MNISGNELVSISCNCASTYFSTFKLVSVPPRSVDFRLYLTGQIEVNILGW